MGVHVGSMIMASHRCLVRDEVIGCEPPREA